MHELKSSEIKKLVVYFLGAYIVSGVFALPLILSPELNSGFVYYALMGLAQFGPLISAACVTLYFGGAKGLRELIKRVGVKFPWYIYVMVLTLPFALMLLSLLLGAGLFNVCPAVWIMAPNTLLTALVSPLGEEIGWRGVATPGLQKALSPILTSLVLGLVWALWHYWLFLIPGMFKNDVPFILFLLSCIADTLWFTWFYNRSGGSILPGILYHFAYNLAYHIVPVNPEYFGGNAAPYAIMIVLQLAGGMIVNLRFSKMEPRKVIDKQ
jgi:membrane protease YdiL (CAAX protease family)